MKKRQKLEPSASQKSRKLTDEQFWHRNLLFKKASPNLLAFLNCAGGVASTRMVLSSCLTPSYWMVYQDLIRHNLSLVYKTFNVEYKTGSLGLLFQQEKQVYYEKRESCYLEQRKQAQIERISDSLISPKYCILLEVLQIAHIIEFLEKNSVICRHLVNFIHMRKN